jgi:glyoxylase-like metal-dependent hydrolase (beta-lactamase superfamily II)
LWSVSALSQDFDFDAIQLETIPVADRIHMVNGGGGNIGVLVGDDGILLIDTMFAELEDKIRKELSALSKAPIRFILNTNWHYDHVMGNAALSNDQATIVSHREARQRMLSEQVFPLLHVKIPPYESRALPDITLTDSMTLHFNGEEIEIFHIEAAHSDSDLAFYFKNANVLHTGDLYFAKMYPFIDINHGGSVDGMIASAEKIIGRIDENTKIIPGHGPLSNREELTDFKNMLLEVRDRIAKHIEAGKSLEEIHAAKPTSDLDEQWGDSELFVRLVYTDLSRP